MDVRRFFKKIEIPDGGVHVIGGPKGLVYVNLHNEEGTPKYKKLELTSKLKIWNSRCREMGRSFLPNKESTSTK